MAERNDIITTSLEHSMSGTFRFDGGTLAVTVVTFLPSGVENQIVFIQPSGVLALCKQTKWLLKQGT